MKYRLIHSSRPSPHMKTDKYIKCNEFNLMDFRLRQNANNLPITLRFKRSFCNFPNTTFMLFPLNESSKFRITNWYIKVRARPRLFYKNAALVFTPKEAKNREKAKAPSLLPLSPSRNAINGKEYIPQPKVTLVKTLKSLSSSRSST